jgi:thymidylate synthase ThyX
MKFFSRLKEFLFGKKEEDKKFDKEMKAAKLEKYSELSDTLISFSDASYMSSLAAKMCIGKEPDEDYEKRLDHISRVVSRGHESTIAHSNIVMLLLIDKELYGKFAEIAPALKFAEYSVSETDYEPVAILIGGSIRAYKYFFREAKDLNNVFCNTIKEVLYQSAEAVFFEDFIEDGIMDRNKFRFYPAAVLNEVVESITNEDGSTSTEEFCDAAPIDRKIQKGKIVDIIYSDDVFAILEQVERYGFTLRDVLKIATCTVIFHDLARIISQQITRHFAAICQESQRYVDYSKAKFIDPTQFNDKYDLSKKYIIGIGSITHELTSSELGDLLLSIYPQLVDQGMLKQDARGFLPLNVDTKLVMTFTHSNLIHFIKERKGNAAQPEVQNATEDMIENLYKYELTTHLFSSIGVEGLIKLCETPVYKNKDGEDLKALDNSIDEVISEEVI